MVDEYTPDSIPAFDPYGGPNIAGGSQVYGDVRASMDRYEDRFKNLLVRTTRNNADLASHYSYTPERYRFYRDGSREVIHYDLAAGNTISGFEDKRAGEEDVFVLSPAAGETLQLRSAERFRYTVDFLSELTHAFALNQSLTNPDDRYTGGLDTSPDGDKSDGHFIEQLSTHSDTAVDLYAKRNGNVIGDRLTVDLQADTQTFQRLKARYAWYNVLGTEWSETTGDTEQDAQNFQLGEVTSVTSDANAGPGGRGPISGNGRAFMEVEADASTTGLELYSGSMSFTTLGGVSSSVKVKGAETDAYTPGQTGSWEPVFALRAKPGRPNVNVDIRGVDLTAGQGKVMPILCDPSNVLDSEGNTLTDADYSMPEEWSGQNAAAEVTDLSTVAQFPDSTGTTQTTASDPGGYQAGFDTSRTSGTGNTQRAASADVDEKHGILDGDVAVFLVKPEDTGTNMHITYAIEFDE